LEETPLEVEPLRGFIEIEVRDREGRVVQRGRHEMHSFVNNLLRALEGFMKSPGGSNTGTTVIGTDGTSKTLYTEDGYSSGQHGGGTPMAAKAPDDDSSYGIVVGSGATPVNLNNYALASPIPHGTSAGQLDYDPVTVEDLGLDTGVSPPVYRLRLIRVFKNLSGGAVNINEVGLMLRSRWYDSLNNIQDLKYLVARDVLPTTYTVPAGGSASVAITVEVVLG
jgi:hypothetical protein